MFGTWSLLASRRDGASLTGGFPSQPGSELVRFGAGKRRACTLLRALAVLLPLADPVYAETADSTLLAARNYVARWLAVLPDIVCRQTTERSTLDRRQMWRRDAISEAELTVEQGTERYRLLSVNGKPASDAQADAAHLWGSSGEFLSAVRRLFDPASKAEFRRRGTCEERGHRLCRYDFKVSQANSQWYVGGNSAYRPAYTGSIWVDVVDGAISRIEMESRAIPSRLTIRSASIQTEFEPATVGGVLHLLPSRSEVVVFANWGYAERRVIKYSSFRRFTAASQLIPEAPQ